MVIDRYLIRQQNESAVLGQIVQSGPISRAAIAGRMRMNKATVSEITKKFIDDQIIEELGLDDRSRNRGRKAILLRLNKRAGVSLCIDLGSDYVSSCITYLDGEIIDAKKEKNLKIHKGNAAATVLGIIRQYEEEQPKSLYGIIGVTIAVHGIIHENKILFTPNYDLDEIPLHEELSRQCKYPVFIENEANLTAVAEATFSSEYPQLVSISIHSGIGAGVIINGSLYTGREGKAGEIGHSILVPHGKPCSCGNHGCLECYCSETAILKKYMELTNTAEATADTIKEAYEAKDAAAIECIQEMAEYLAVGINNLIVSFAPEIIFLNNPILRRIPDIVDKIRENLPSSFSSSVEIRNSTLGSKAALFGAASVNIMNFLQVDRLNLVDTDAFDDLQ
ncbi:MAG: ROK family protein [Lachnospiraceae bacterium]